MKNGTYRVDGEHIVSEEIDGETLVINYDTGTYYSFLGPSSLVWKLIGARKGVAAIVAALGAAYVADADVLERAVLDFVPKLREAGLIVPDDTGAEVAVAPDLPAVADLTREKTPFAPLEFKTFTDLQDLLVLDPIHDVDQTGWPAIPAAPERKGG